MKKITTLFTLALIGASFCATAQEAPQPQTESETAVSTNVVPTDAAQELIEDAVADAVAEVEGAELTEQQEGIIDKVPDGVKWVTMVIGLASLLAAAAPKGSNAPSWAKFLRKSLDTIAANWGNAKNKD